MRLPGVRKADVGGYELRHDGSWWYCVEYRGDRGYVLEQFKERARAAQWCRDNASKGETQSG